MSFFRKCKGCGETISFRQMPAGQWVAFDPGTDEAHVCRPTLRRTSNCGATSATESSTRLQERELARWKRMSKRPIDRDLLEEDDLGLRLAYAIQQGLKVEILYSGGSQPLQRRIVKPGEMFERDGYFYVQGFCNLRNEKRTFRLDRIVGARILGRGGTYPTEESFRPKQIPGPTDSPESVRHFAKSSPNTSSGNVKNIISTLMEWLWIGLVLFGLYLLLR